MEGNGMEGNSMEGRKEKVNSEEKRGIFQRMLLHSRKLI